MFAQLLACYKDKQKFFIAESFPIDCLRFTILQFPFALFAL